MDRATRGGPAYWARTAIAAVLGFLAFAVGFAAAVVVFFASPAASYVVVGTLVVAGVAAFALTDDPFIVALASGAALAGVLAVFLLFFLAADAGSDVEDTAPAPAWATSPA
jgi:hypothetical protein